MDHNSARDMIQQGPYSPLSDVVLYLVDEAASLAEQIRSERSRIRDLQREMDELKGHLCGCTATGGK